MDKVRLQSIGTLLNSVSMHRAPLMLYAALGQSPCRWSPNLTEANIIKNCHLGSPFYRVQSLGHQVKCSAVVKTGIILWGLWIDLTIKLLGILGLRYL